MLKLIWGAAIAATLAFAPAASSNSAVTSAPAPVAAAAVAAARPAVHAAEFGLDVARDSGLAPGQTAADFRAWLSASPDNRARLTEFRTHLAAQGLQSVVPLWQLVRTSSSWRQCGAEPFETPPADKWQHIVTTLKFVRDEVVPAVGKVEVVSGYRNARLNACSDGAPHSAHREYYALDLTPVNAAVTRSDMIHNVCAAHARDGRPYRAGLGFYTGRRFHVDSSSYRKWGANGKGATSPCVRSA